MKKKLVLFFFICAQLNTVWSQESFSDCTGAIIVCDKVDLVVKNLFGAGQEIEEIGFTSCSNRLSEKNSIWLKWEVEEPGLIEFIITPLNKSDDIDFIVYKLEDNLFNCSKKFEIRCMAAGESLGDINERSEYCTGKTGLKKNTLDTIESDGCKGNQDNFLSAINAKNGEKYILYINNYSSNIGFKLEWSGSATFREIVKESKDIDDFKIYSKAIFFKAGNDNSIEPANMNISFHRAPIIKNKNLKSSNPYIGCNYSTDTISMHDLNVDMEISNLFPNPASFLVNLAINSNINTFVNINLYDVMGRLFFNDDYFLEKGVRTIHISTDKIPSGFYIVSIKTGNILFSKKLIVSH